MVTPDDPGAPFVLWRGDVWGRPALRDAERLKGTLRRAAPRVYKPTRGSSAHLNQKPLELMERILRAVTDEGDVVWEPFGGLASASAAAVALGRRACAAEIDPCFADLAEGRLRLAVKNAQSGRPRTLGEGDGDPPPS